MKQELVNQLLNQFKSPLYVFDLEELKRRVSFLREHLPSVSLCYAIKANPFLVSALDSIVDKFELCSPGEYEICKESGVAKQKMVISGVYKTPEVVESMFQEENDCVYTVESKNQFLLLEQLSQKYHRPCSILLRLTSGNQFGLEETELNQIVQNRAHYAYLKLIGIQYFSGTQKTSLKRLQKELDYIEEYFVFLKEQYDFVPDEFEFGPGFPVFYFESKENFNEVEFLESFSSMLKQMKYQGALTLELGRSICASCGNYLTKVVDLKTNKGQNYAILDGGMHHLVYYGQMMAMKYPYYEKFPYQDAKEEIWNLCGSLCTINDIIVKQLPVKGLHLGDVFVFQNTGAYSMTEGISLFLSRELPQIVFLDGNEMTLVRDAFPTFILNKPRKDEKNGTIN